jgi:hypothetical protein
MIVYVLPLNFTPPEDCNICIFTVKWIEEKKKI